MFEELRPHLVELRKRLGLSVLSVLAAFMVAFFFHKPILSWITQPLNNALAQVGQKIVSQNLTHWQTNLTTPTQSPEVTLAQSMAKHLQDAANSATKELKHSLKEAADAAKALSRLLQAKQEHDFDGKITTHQVGGAFFVALKVSFFAAILGALPFILFQLWLFIAPGLYNNEKKMILPFVIGGSLMFFIGVIFAYYVVTPFGFEFLITFGSFLYTPLINIEDYVGFFTKIMFGFGLSFELPVFTYFLALLGLVTDRGMKDFFKYAVVIIFIIAALLTPPDILTQLLMAAPLVLLYGISILIARMVNPYKDED